MRKIDSVKKRLISLVAMLLVVVMCASLLISCTDESENNSSTENTSESSVASGEKTNYSVSVKTAGGLAMAELNIYIYEGSDLSNMKDYAKTNADGEVTFSLAKGGNYSIVISDAPKGYKVEEKYSFNGEKAEIVLTSSLVNDEELSSASIKTGDIMYDFTIMASDGSEIKLSEVLKTKKLVVLNFWYTTCSWCMEEFPLMDEIYAEYKEEVEIIAVNPLEDTNVVDGFKKQQGYSFPMAACPSAWANTFSVQGYPTSVFIDRYGMVCVVESGAIVSKRPWVSAFEHFTAESYKQQLCVNGVGDLVSQIKPTYEMPTSEEIGAILNNGDVNVTYRPETDKDSAEFAWPFIKGEKLGKDCIYASNKGIDESFAIIYADVELKAGQALGFDYLASSERICDILYVIVNDNDIFQISGVSDNEQWQTCYPCVAKEDGVYEVALCYLKDTDGSAGDDTVYISNLRVVDASEIDTETYLPRDAAKEDENGGYKYVEVVFNEKDGYYHVGSENGPLLLADLMGYSNFNEESSVYELVYAGNADKNGISLYNKKTDGGLGMVDYFSYASNSALNGICTVNKELGEMLKQVAEVAGFDGDENEWLKMCIYYEVYGTDKQFADPIKGLANFSAYEATLGKDVETNYFYYDRVIMPRGLLAKFVPKTSGVYRFTSKSDYADGIDAWLFDDNGIIYTYEHDERMYDDANNCSIVYYMEAGKAYYVNMAFWDVYATGYIYYDVQYLGSTYDLFRLASPGYFTYDTDATGELLYDIIAAGKKPILKDGYYYAEGEDSLLYADFSGLTSVFGQSIVQMIEMQGFNFKLSETDGEILAYLRQNGNDVEKTDEYLKKLWGSDYESNAELYQIEDVFNGKYHGDGEDLTEEIRAYVDKMDKSSNIERNGCVAVDERLAEILQLLMDKYTFEGVENSWTKLCYYYDHLGPEA